MPPKRAIAAGLGRLNDQIRQAQQALGNQGQGNNEEALNRVERLRSQMEALTRSGMDSLASAANRAATRRAAGGNKAASKLANKVASKAAVENKGGQAAGVQIRVAVMALTAVTVADNRRAWRRTPLRSRI